MQSQPASINCMLCEKGKSFRSMFLCYYLLKQNKLLTKNMLSLEQLRARTHNTRIAPSTDILTKSLINMEIFFIFDVFSEQSQPEAFLFSPENEWLTISETLGNEHKMKMECCTPNSFYLGLKFVINELAFIKVLIKSTVSAKRLSHSPLPDETTTQIPEPRPFQFTTSSWT